jgi:Toprim domain
MALTEVCNAAMASKSLWEGGTSRLRIVTVAIRRASPKTQVSGGSVMGYFSNLDIERRNQAERGRQGIDEDDLTVIAKKLGGEIDGRFIRCPSPGCPPDDRSCWVLINGGNHVFIYDCQGSSSRARAIVCKKIGLEEEPKRDHSEAIGKILASTIPAAGSRAERYLRGRAITLVPPPALRFSDSLRHSPTGTQHPAMVAERHDVSGRLVAIHRTYLRWDGKGKANIEPVRMDLGAVQGSAIRLSPVADELAIGEGIETMLSVIQETGRPGWAAGSAVMLRHLVLPPEVRSVMICADGDEPGELAARAAADRWSAEGRKVRIARAPWGTDFNDLLTGRASS